MNAKEFARLVARDGGCLHCGQTEAIAPNHRANRGMGGSKSLDVPSNLVVLCSWLNGAIEADSGLRLMAIRYGWKVSKWDEWRNKPVFHAQSGEWRLLDDRFGFIVVMQEREI